MNNKKTRPEGIRWLCLCKFCAPGGSLQKRIDLKRFNRAIRRQSKREIEQQLSEGN